MGDADEFSWSAVLDLAVSGGGALRVNPSHGLGFDPASPLGRGVRQIGWRNFTRSLLLVHPKSRIGPRTGAVRGDLVWSCAFRIYDFLGMEIQTL